jgi:ribonuclease BN (tRNA processing enzyme)
VPFLVCHERYEGSRTKALSVLGPRGTKDVVDAATRLFFPGMEPLPFPVEYRDLEPGEAHAADGLLFHPFEVDHFSRGTAFGYRLALEGRTLVYSGDTAWTEALVRESEGADLFVCECSSFEVRIERHISHSELRKNRDRIRAKRTVLVHPGEDVIARKDELVFELATDGTRWTL